MLPVLWNQGARTNRVWAPDSLASFFPSIFEGEAEAAPYAFAFDVLETEDGYEVKLDLPGIAKEDLKIGVENDVVTIRGSRKAPEPREGAYARTERWSGEIERKLSLGQGLDASKLTASLKDGVLTLVIPKAESAKPREIKVS